MTHTSDERKEIQRAVGFAARAHAGQFRKKSGLPYIVHPMAVLSQISEWDITNLAMWKAALCHDVLEDRPNIPPAQMAKAIGEEATGIVLELTFIPDPSSSAPVHFQKQEYMDSFRDKSVPALVIKVADRICNTFDFLCTDADYAPKYWKKATNLFDVMMDRSNEITAYFDDESIIAHIKYSRTTLGRMVQ